MSMMLLKAAARVIAPTPVAVAFDGTNDYWTRGAALNGAADGQYVAGYAKFKFNTISATAVLFASGGGLFRIRLEGTGKIEVKTSTSVPGTVCELISTSDWDDNSTHELWWNYNANSGVGKLYVDGTDNLNGGASTQNTGTIDFTHTSWSVGAAVDGSSKCTADFTRMALWITNSSDLSSDFDVTTANDRTAMANHAQRRTLGSGSILDMFGAAINWNSGKNYGSGGNGTMNGAVA